MRPKTPNGRVLAHHGSDGQPYDQDSILDRELEERLPLLRKASNSLTGLIMPLRGSDKERPHMASKNCDWREYKLEFLDEYL